ncbi:hypothetical protein NCPPB3778_65 [Rathayibacter phage NCPPB3778]|nr:hypothetical protein NCPPB3778_65 [Rathayibacter phage NCPPB3778]
MTITRMAAVVTQIATNTGNKLNKTLKDSFNAATRPALSYESYPQIPDSTEINPERYGDIWNILDLIQCENYDLRKAINVGDFQQVKYIARSLSGLAAQLSDVTFKMSEGK